MRSLPILILLFATLALPALAGDGVLEINQTCATQTGCFEGDTAGLPVTISASGSYRLTSNLVVPDQNTSGIQLSTDDVGIDLNNFTIQGPVVCSTSPFACTPNTGSGSGVEVTSSLLSGISVRNGSIRGMGNYGVLLGVQSEVTNVRVRSNRSDGISTSFGSTVSGNTAYKNGRRGIFASAGSTLSGNTVFQNGNIGLSAGSGCTVSGNTAWLNGFTGIFAGEGSTVSGNTAYDNDSDGIQASFGTTVWGNTVRRNTGFGLVVGPEAGYRENVISLNTRGTVQGSANAGNNICDGLPTCP